VRGSSLFFSCAAHVLTSTHNFVHKQKLLGEYGRNIQELSLHDVVVPNCGHSCGQGLTSVNINTERLLFLQVSLLYFKKHILAIKAGVLSESAGNDEESISKGENSELGLSGNLGAAVLHKVFSAGNFESTSSGEHALVLQSVGDSSETVTDSVSSLCNRVIVGSLDQDGAGEGVLNTLDKGVLVFTESLFIDNLGETHIGFSHVFDGVEHLTTASERNTFTVSLLGATDANDAGTGQDLKGRGVNTLLVDDD
jgi:hypothetical protein